MRRPVKFKSQSIRGFLCIVLALANVVFFVERGRTQSREKVAIKSDRNKPLKAPTKTSTQAKSEKSNKPVERSDPDQSPSAPLSNCVYEDILVLDTIRIVFVQLFNYPPNSAISVTVTQTNAGVVGYALTPAGPFAPTLNTVVNTDSNGYGESVDIFTQGQLVGTTTTYGETPYGTTDTIDFNVLPQCNCPAIPVVP